VNCISRDSTSHLLTHLVVYIIALCSSLNTTTFFLFCPVLPYPTSDIRSVVLREASLVFPKVRSMRRRFHRKFHRRPQAKEHLSGLQLLTCSLCALVRLSRPRLPPADYPWCLVRQCFFMLLLLQDTCWHWFGSSWHSSPSAYTGSCGTGLGAPLGTSSSLGYWMSPAQLRTCSPTIYTCLQLVLCCSYRWPSI
jgi:hypothetical protein